MSLACCRLENLESGPWKIDKGLCVCLKGTEGHTSHFTFSQHGTKMGFWHRPRWLMLDIWGLWVSNKFMADIRCPGNPKVIVMFYNNTWQNATFVWLWINMALMSEASTLVSLWVLVCTHTSVCVPWVPGCPPASDFCVQVNKTSLICL